MVSDIQTQEYIPLNHLHGYLAKLHKHADVQKTIQSFSQSTKKSISIGLWRNGRNNRHCHSNHSS